MVNLGKRNMLRIMREAPQGLYLDGENLGDILIPNCFVPPGSTVGQRLDVFVYCDSDDRLIATTQVPRVEVGGFACLQVVNVDERIGAFLDWGLDKDLFLPKREQTDILYPGDWILVHALEDKTSRRIVATTRLQHYLNLTEPTYRKGEKVELIVMAMNKLGYSCIVAGAHVGLLYHTDVRVDLFHGQKMDGYVKLVREDGKIDLALDPAGYSRVAPLADRIVEELKAKGGRLSLCDDSSPDEIRTAFGVSKKSFKQAIGALFKERRIVMLERGIALPFDKTPRR